VFDGVFDFCQIYTGGTLGSWGVCEETCELGGLTSVAVLACYRCGGAA
jgi:hypothetical protein